MDQEIKSLIQELEMRGGLSCAQKAAAILRAVFDPENQPSQFGTVLQERQIDVSLTKIIRREFQNGKISFFDAATGLIDAGFEAADAELEVAFWADLRG